MKRPLSLSVRRRRLAALGLTALVLAVVFLGYSTLFAVEALQNPGFENEPDHLHNWAMSGPSGNWSVVGTEWPAQQPTYTQMGNVVVEPFSGEHMLRLGVPQGKDNHQVRAVTKAEQTFIATDTDRLAVAFRLFSWEHREGRDAFTIDIKTTSGESTGTLEYPVGVELPTHSAIASGALPYRLSLDIGSASYLDSGWTIVRIKDIPRNQVLKLTYTLNTDRDAAHDSWVYLDWWNQAPTARFQYAPAAPVEDAPVTLDGMLSTEPDIAFEDGIASWSWTVTKLSDGSSQKMAGPAASWTPAEPGSYRVDLKVMDTFGAESTASKTIQVAESNKAPVASIELLAENPEEGPYTYEGYYVDLAGDGSTDPNQDDVLTYKWKVSGPGGQAEESTDQNVYFIPERDGTFIAELTVTDGHGASAKATKEIAVKNSAPGAAALSIEVLEGKPVGLFGRFIDCGWLDEHTAKWSLAGNEFVSATREDNLPCVSSGITTAAASVSVAAGQVLDGDLSIGDGPAASTIPFTVTGIADDAQRLEPNGVLDGDPPAIRASSVRLSYIQSAGDVDFFEVKMPDGSPLRYDTEVLVTLKDLPADYDVAVLEKLPDDPNSAPMRTAPMRTAPMRTAPMRTAPMRTAPMRTAPMRTAPMRTAPMRTAPMRTAPMRTAPMRTAPMRTAPMRTAPVDAAAPDITAYPLSNMSYIVDDNTQILGAGDIEFTEMGLDPLIPADTVVSGFSAGRGVSNEAVLTKVQYEGSRVFVAVVGANGACSDDPYALQVEASLPYTLTETVGRTPHEPLVTTGATTTSTVVVEPEQTQKTLIVTSPERMKALYPDLWESLEASLVAFAGREDIDGTVLALPSIIYNAWDQDPYSVDKANEVTDEILAAVRQYLTADTKYVVLVGGDRVIPQRRVKDRTLISNEAYYADSSFVTPDSPLASSLFGGYDLTDDFYVDLTPSSWEGGEVYAPDLAVGRLVEEPSEIKRTLAVYAESGGISSPQTALVTGYDFFIDGGQAAAARFASVGLETDASLLSSSWTAAQLEAALLNPAKGITDVNAHFAHYAALSAAGFSGLGGYDFSDMLRSGDLASTPSALEGQLVLSMGCHSGLNVPDGDVLAGAEDFGIDPKLDFPQAMARQGATFIAPTGFGIGDDAGIAGTERLLGMFAGEITKSSGMTVGDALVSAKQKYLTSLGQMTSYDVKSSADWTLYGLPMYRMSVPSPKPVSQSARSGAAEWSSAGLVSLMGLFEPGVDRPVAVTVKDGSSTIEATRTLSPVVSSSGTYYHAGDPVRDVVNIEGRPIQPSFPIPLGAAGGAVHGVLLTGATFSERPNMDPAMATPVIGWLTGVTENEVAIDSFWPGWTAVLNDVDTQPATRNLVVRPGQFKATSQEGQPVVGVQRLYDSLEYEVLRSAIDDPDAPRIGAVNLFVSGEGTLTAVVNTGPEAEALRAIEVLVVGDSTMTGTRFVPDGPDTTHIIEVMKLAPGTDPASVSVVVQAADMAGNVAVSTGKGATLRVVSVDAGSPQMTAPGTPITLTGTITGWDRLAQPVTYNWDFGDGTSRSGLIDTFELSPDGTTATFEVSHTYTGLLAATATLRIVDSYGGAGVDTVTWLPMPTIAVDAGDDMTFAPGSIVDLKATIADYESLLEPVTYEWDFGDGTSASGLVSVTETGPAGSSFVVPHLYTTDAPMTATVTIRDDAGVYGTDSVALVPLPPPVTLWFVSTTGNDTTGDGSAGAPWRTIQHAIDTAPEAATIRVEYGTYTESVRMWKDGQRLEGYTPTSTVIAGPGTGTTLEIETNTNDVEVRSFRITGGRATTGGGVFCDRYSSVTFTNCWIQGNFTVGPGTNGAGVWAEEADLTLDGCLVVGNNATGNGGGVGMRAVFSPGTGTIRDCTIDSNTAAQGAGIYTQNVPLTITETTITANTANGPSAGGGGVYVMGSVATACPLVVERSFVASNVATSYGGGIWSSYARPAISRTRFEGNSSSQAGGALYEFVNQGSRVTNSLFWRNQSAYGGAAVRSGSATDALFCNNTVYGNMTSIPGAGGGGFYATDNATTIFNCIFAGNTVAGVLDDLGGPATTAYSYVSDGSMGLTNGNLSGVAPYPPPGFADGSAGDFRLTVGSACVDVGIDVWNGNAAPAADFTGLARPQNGVWDMGAYEAGPS